MDKLGWTRFMLGQLFKPKIQLHGKVFLETLRIFLTL